MFYGLFVNGECEYVIKYNDGKPSIFDFGIPIFNTNVYEVISVDVNLRKFSF